MLTQCNTKPLEFEAHGRRRVVLLSTEVPSLHGGLSLGLGARLQVVGDKGLEFCETHRDMRVDRCGSVGVHSFVP